LIGLDTNILVRLITQDDPIQSAIVNDFFERHLSETMLGFVSVVVIVETVWVLQRRYKLSNRTTAQAIQRILDTQTIVVEREAEVFIAVGALRRGKGGFTDTLIGALGRRSGCSMTLSFDQKALRLPWFKHPGNV
jgi:predicted nucleic-acid-binding protein